MAAIARHWRVARSFGLAGMLLALGQLAGCATAISRDAMEQVSPGIAPGAVLADPGRYLGRAILVAGPILGLENREDGAMLEILGYPTTDRGFPDTTEPALGRFFLRYPGYLDSMVYRPGRSIAAAGRVEGERAVTIGETTRRQPVLRSLELALLPEHPTYYTPIYFGIGISGGF